MDDALDGEEEPIVAQLDRENLRRQLTREKTKIIKFPRGRTDPKRLKIPADWKKYANGERFIVYDSGRSEDRVVIMSSPYLMEVGICSGEQ